MNNIFSKAGLLFLVQVDHLSGELLGSAVEYLYAAGARNVQMLPGVTKKNRPGQSIIIDAPEERSEDIERIIVEELGSPGWHRFKTEHRHLPVESIGQATRVEIGSEHFIFELRGKRIKNQPETVRPEHSSCLELQRLLRERTGREISLSRIFAQAQSALRQPGEEPPIFSFEPPQKRD